MIRLQNIKKHDSVISCEAFFEDCEEAVELRYSVKEQRLRDFRLPEGYEWCDAHVGFVRRYFESFGNEEPPEQMTIMWY